MTFWRPFWRIFVRSRAVASPAKPPPFRSVLLLITWGREKSHRAVVRSTVRRQSKFQSVSGRGPRRVWGEAGSQLGALSLFLTEQQAPHRSRELSKTSGLYSAVTHHTHYSLRRPGSFNLDLIGLSLLVNKWGLVLPHPVYEAARGSRSN